MINLSFNVVVPSYKRADIIKNHFVNELCELVSCCVVVPKDQAEAYKNNVAKKVEIVVIPDDYEGKLLRKRNWILDNLFIEDFLVMSDDDVSGMIMLTDLSGELLTPKEMCDVFVSGYELCNYYDLGYFAFAHNSMIANLTAKKMTISNNYGSEVLCGFTKKNVRYNEEFIFRGDIDLYFKQLIKHSGVMKINMFCVKNMTSHGKGKGGLREMVNKEAMNHDNDLLRKQYGKFAQNQIDSLISKGKGVYHE